MYNYFRLILALFALVSFHSSTAQITIDPALEVLDYTSPRTYQIGGLTVSGTKNLDHSALKAISGLQEGMEIQIPGDAISDAILDTLSGLFGNHFWIPCCALMMSVAESGSLVRLLRMSTPHKR